MSPVLKHSFRRRGGEQPHGLLAFVRGHGLLGAFGIVGVVSYRKKRFNSLSAGLLGPEINTNLMPEIFKKINPTHKKIPVNLNLEKF